MPTIEPQLDTRQRKAKVYPIIIYVYHKRKRKIIPTGYKIEKKYWGNGEVIKHVDAPIINSKIADLVSEVKNYFAECQLKKRAPNLEYLGQGHRSYSLTRFLQEQVKEYSQKDMPVMRQKTNRIAKDIQECFQREVYFDELTPAAIRELDTHLTKKNKGVTRKLKFEVLGDWYDRAVTDGKADGPNPFDDYKINTKPVKRSKLTASEITAIENLVIEPGPVNDARNLFLFAYYCKGQRFQTCVTIQKKAIRNGRIEFKTNKGEKFISVKIHERLQKILDYYKDLPGKFILPYVTALPETKRSMVTMIGNLNAEANVHLKTVAEKAGITINLTYHIARHSFAFHLKKQTKNINVIQEALGHSDQRTTRIYLKELDDEDIDDEVGKLYGK